MKILLSIRPEYVEKIISGEKHFEFRRKLPRKEKIEAVVVYATKPIGKVVGEFAIQDILSMPPDQLWERTREKSGISKDFFDQYFESKDTAHAFHIREFQKYHEPKQLSELIPSGCAPQSFCYI